MLDRILSAFRSRLRPGYGIFPLGVALEKARQELQLDRATLASRLDISEAELRRLEWGAIPSTGLLRRITELFVDGPRGRAYIVMVRERIPEEPMQAPSNFVQA